MDVYSLGMLLWELWHEMVPFNNELELAKEYVLKEEARPEIESRVCNIEMTKLIRLCWQ